MADFWISLGHGSVCYMLLCIYQRDPPLRGHWRAILPRPTAQTAIKKKKKKKDVWLVQSCMNLEHL